MNEQDGAAAVLMDAKTMDTTTPPNDNKRGGGEYVNEAHAHDDQVIKPKIIKIIGSRPTNYSSKLAVLGVYPPPSSSLSTSKIIN